MNSLFINKSNKKEKEPALSLLRIPINFFSEDNSSEDNSTIKDTSSSDKVKLNKSTLASNSKDANIDLNSNNTSTTFHINTMLNVNPSPNKETTTKIASTENNNFEKEALMDLENNEDTVVEEVIPKSNKKNSNDSKKEDTVSKDENKNTNKQDNTSPTVPQPKSNTSNFIPSTPENNLTPSSDDINSTTPSPKNNEPSTPTKENTAKTSDNSSKEDVNEQADLQRKKWDNYNKQNKTSTPKTPNKDKKADEFKDKFGKSPVGKKLKSGLDNSNLKDKASDTLAKHPEASKALGALKSANDLKNAVKDADMDKAQEAVGDALVKGASEGAKALDAVAPGVGTAASATIKAADATVGQTKVGKKAKKLFGKCCCACSCMIPILILIPIVIMILAMSWITNLFSRDDTIEGELTEAEKTKLAEASELYSMQQYTEDTTKLNNPDFITSLLGRTSDAPIQDVLEKYLNEHYYFTQDDVDEYNSKYDDLIEKGYLFPIKEGELTSFGMAFELITDNYSIRNLKAPASAPQRKKTLPNGEKVTYTTYDPTGIHQPLFEDVLNNIDGLKIRFDGQVREEWFDELDSMLDEKFPVFLEGHDSPDLIDNPPQRSLRELFKETSRQVNDTEYYTSLIEISFGMYNQHPNSEIVAQYDELVQRLSMLEIMTYMLSYQKYYNRIEQFKKEYGSSGYANLYVYDETFFAQFLTFTNLEYYLALSSLADHSLTYEIAVASISASLDNITVSTYQQAGKKYLSISKFDNWYATFYLNPNFVEKDGTVYTTIQPTIEKTQIQQFLFDKYNVEADIFDEERSKGENQNSFFSAFELATGINMSIMSDLAVKNGLGEDQVPIYVVNPDVISDSATMPLISSEDKAFPLSDTTNARVSIGYNQTYSAATTSALGMSSNKKHSGIDYAVSSGTTVVAAASGTATVVRGNTGFGNYVKIEHEDGYSSYYAHGNGTFYISNGSKVSAGQPIMQSGNSGNSTGSHLHFEVRNPSGTSINPNLYLAQGA